MLAHFLAEANKNGKSQRLFPFSELRILFFLLFFFLLCKQQKTWKKSDVYRSLSLISA